MQDNKRKRTNWSQAIGWLIFLLAVAGGPIINRLRQLLGGTISLPSTGNLLPLLIGGLVLLSVVVSVISAVARASGSRGETRLPTGVPPTSTLPPMRLPSAPKLPGSRPPAPGQLPSAPRFEPILNPLVVIVGLVGLAALGLLGLVVFGAGLP